METAQGFWKKVGLVALSLVVFLVFHQWINSPMIITVTGMGEVSAPAESATLTFTVSGESDNTSGAVNSVKDKIKRIKENLATQGVSTSDIYESQIAVYPSSSLNEGSQGYTAVTTMGLKTVQVQNVDGIILDLYAQGSTLVSQPVLSVEDYADLENEAFNLAIKDAKKKASKIAFKNFKFLKKIVLIEQTDSTPTSSVTTKADIETQVDQNISPETGVLKIQKNLSVSYKMW